MSEATVAVKAEPRLKYLRTACGTEVTVARLALGDGQHPVARVFVGMADEPDHEPAAWAGLTLPEARELARTLLSRAAAAPCQRARATRAAQVCPAGSRVALHRA